jgi:ribA/ribD-fused uncharacterized protein
MIKFKKKNLDYLVHDEENIKGFSGEYEWLSNFYESEVIYQGIKYRSTENAYQAAKCESNANRRSFMKIKPYKAKELGRLVQKNGHARSDWKQVQLKVMYDVCADKFYRNIELREKLVKTGNKYLEETNDWNDTFFGVCNGIGENNLGKILMKIRDCWKNAS